MKFQGLSAAQKVSKVVMAAVKYALLCLMAFVVILPLYACVVTAFKNKQEYQSTNVMMLPQNWLDFSNFVTAWKDADMGLAFLNSIIILVCVLAGSILISAMLAYILSRFKFPGNALVRNLFLFATLIPGIAMQVTVYKIMYNLNLINTLPGYILLMMGTGVLITIVPAIVIFLIFQKQVYSGLAAGAVKG